jgi:putative Mn2+ efflux pump MntP
MSLTSLLFIAFGLSMDAFAVAIANGIAMKKFHVRHALRIAFFFGAFQAIMPILGWLAGSELREVIAVADHWVAFGLLTLIGGKMIYEAIKVDLCVCEDGCPRCRGDEASGAAAAHKSLYVLLVLSIATSIDALAVGISLSFLDVRIMTPALVIGAVTFLLSFIGVYLGDRLGCVLRRRVEIAGGAILIAIGVKILFDHLEIW